MNDIPPGHAAGDHGEDVLLIRGFGVEHVGPALRENLQALGRHRFVEPFPGKRALLDR